MNAYTSSTKVIPFRSRKASRYPNAAQRKYILDRAVDYALTAVTSAGLITALLFLMML